MKNGMLGRWDEMSPVGYRLLSLCKLVKQQNNPSQAMPAWPPSARHIVYRHPEFCLDPSHRAWWGLGMEMGSEEGILHAVFRRLWLLLMQLSVGNRCW